METSLFAGADKRVAAAARSGREGRRFETGESSGSGFDPELSAARVYLRRIVSVQFVIFVAISQLVCVRQWSCILEWRVLVG